MAPISVLVVDDSVVVRKLVTDALSAAEDIAVVGTAPNGRVALSKLDSLAPDLVTLDIEMPVMDGLETLRELRKTHPRLPVVMFSTLTERGAAATLEALSAGASDYVTKPANVGSVTESMAAVREQLVPRIRVLCGRGAVAPALPALPGPRAAAGSPAGAGARRGAPVPPPRPPALDRVDVLAVGCSTGGPEALAAFLSRMPRDLPVPVVVVQHMPKVFTRLFADRLDRTCALKVVEAGDAQALLPGTVYLAPGDYHLEVTSAGRAVTTRLHQDPPENFCRPAVDVLFRSVRRVYAGRTVAVVLTGMGSDGRRGCEELKAAGAHVAVQDEATSVVWGMPGAVAGAGLADVVLPLPQFGGYVLSAVGASRRTAGSAVAGITERRPTR